MNNFAARLFTRNRFNNELCLICTVIANSLPPISREPRTDAGLAKRRRESGRTTWMFHHRENDTQLPRAKLRDTNRVRTSPAGRSSLGSRLENRAPLLRPHAPRERRPRSQRSRSTGLGRLIFKWRKLQDGPCSAEILREAKRTETCF